MPYLSGKWIIRDADRHRCQKPTKTKGVAKDDVWQCEDCQKKWAVQKIDHDQRDNSSWITWIEYFKVDYS